MKLLKKCSVRKVRTARGAYLLELLVAIFVSGVMAAAIMTSITEGMRTTQASGNQVLATWLAKEAFERIRMSAAQVDPQNVWSTSTLGALEVPNNGEVSFKIKSTDPITLSSYDFVQRPLLLDLDSLKWIDKRGDESTPANFDGTATATFNDTDNGGKIVLVKIIWRESNAAEQKTFFLKGAIFPQSNFRNF